MWLKGRLNLDISEEKSKVVNFKKHYSEFPGFKLKAMKKGKKYIVRSHMADSEIKKAEEKLIARIKEIRKFGVIKKRSHGYQLLQLYGVGNS